MMSKNCGYITNNTKKVQKEKTEGGGLEGRKRGRENERDLFSSLINPATMQQEKQKLQFFATSSSIVGQS